jgi:hypothetical protein
MFADASDGNDREDSVDESNDTNEADLLYFARVSNHYLCLVKAAPGQDLLSHHQVKFPVIAIHPPIIRSVDKPSSSLPRTVTVSEDCLCASVGFRRVDSMLQHFKDLYQDTLKIDHLPADAVLDPGDYATL